MDFVHDIMKNSGKLLVGDARAEMGKEMLRTLAGVVEARQLCRKPYYVLIYSRRDRFTPKVINTKIIVSAEVPGKMLGTICFLVDNVAGRISRKWALPLDLPIEVSGDGTLAPSVLCDVRGLPILN